MNKLLSVLLVALLMVGCGEEADLDDKETLDKIIADAIDDDKLQERGKEGEELHYAPNQQTPYTGWAKSMHDNGQIMELGHYKDGKPDGQGVAWYENGQKMSEASFKDGKKNGLAKGWYSDGQKKAEGNFKDGKMDGLWTERGPRGEKIEGNFKDGKKDGLVTTWHGNGFFDADWTFLTGWQRKEYLQRGQKRSEAIWKDGEETSIKEWEYTYYRNGEKMEEHSVLQFRQDWDWHWPGLGGALVSADRSGRVPPVDRLDLAGTPYKPELPRRRSMYWYENGQKKKEATYLKDWGIPKMQTTWYQNGQKQSKISTKPNSWKDYADGFGFRITTVVVWKPNGEKCPVTKVVDRNGSVEGVFVFYNDDGTEKRRVEDSFELDEMFHFGFD